jgi:NADH-quinone oxidoreductase subunit M
VKIGLLSAVTFLPLLGAIALAFVPRRSTHGIRTAGLVVALVTLALSLPLYFGFDAEQADYQFVEEARWIPALGVGYHLGIDGISLLLVLLTTFLTPIALAAAWHTIEDRVKEFVMTMLVLETGMLGVFVSLDVFLFYVFWEAMLVPMYLIIGVWGGENRVYAAIKFVLYTLVGSLLMLVAILALYFQHGSATGVYTFDLPVLVRWVMPAGLAQNLMFLAFALAFAIKVPLFPFHTWLPDAHVEAPTAGSVILAGVLLKMGTYGILRMNFAILPGATADLAFFFLGVIGAINIVYGALCAMAQKDLKKLVAYSSVSHMGYVMLGMAAFTPQGINGAVLQMFSHGIMTALFFAMVGSVYDQAHTRDMRLFSGLVSKMPLFVFFFGIAGLASLGLPGLSGFIAEFHVFVGTFETYPWAGALGIFAAMITAVYILRMMSMSFFGPFDEKWNELKEMTFLERGTAVMLTGFLLFMGLWPAPFVDRIEQSVRLLPGVT